MAGFGSKLWKVSRCSPAVSNETILATRREFLLTKVAPVQGIIDIVLLLDYCCSPERLFHPTLTLFCKEIYCF